MIVLLTSFRLRFYSVLSFRSLSNKCFFFPKNRDLLWKACFELAQIVQAFGTDDVVVVVADVLVLHVVDMLEARTSRVTSTGYTVWPILPSI